MMYFNYQSSTFTMFLILIVINQSITVSLARSENRKIKSSKSTQTSKWMLNKPQCRSEKRQTKVNEFMEKLVVFGQSDRKFPENFAQVKPFCSETREMIAYIEDYLKECFQPDIQSLANILIYTLKRHIRVFCNKRSNNLRLKKLLPLMPCINEQVQRYPQCIRTMMNKTSELIASQIEDRSKIKYVC
ncbi:hypothetical protein SSS_01624 [Sarcoptes scabiei]|nr:hypothetical protein SSS_01624 [Sarcoptes scabiei]